MHTWLERLTAWVRPEKQRAKPSPRLCLEQLEDRLAPATITVLTNGDATGALTNLGGGNFTAPTLRAAIDGANDMAGADTIRFRTGGLAGGQTITAALNDTNNPFAFGPTAFVITDNLTIHGAPNARIRS